MGRPRKQDADWFKHDKDMRDDPKVKALRRKYGLPGYAVFCMMIEILTDSDGFSTVRNPLSTELWSGDITIETSELDTILDYCIKVGLFEASPNPHGEGVLLSSVRHKRDMQVLLDIRNVHRESFGRAKSPEETRGEETRGEGERRPPSSAPPSPQERAGEPSSTKVHTLDSVLDRMRETEPGLAVGLAQREQLEAVRVAVGDDTLIAVWAWSRKNKPKALRWFLEEWSSMLGAWQKAKPAGNKTGNGVYQPVTPVPRTPEDDQEVERIAARFRQEHHQPLSDRDRELLGAASPVGEFPEGAA